MNAIFKRKSIRQFLDKEIEDEKIERLLRAGMQAPSAINSQPWEFLVVKDKEGIEKIEKITNGFSRIWEHVHRIYCYRQ